MAVFWHFIEFLNENGAFFLKAFHNRAVVNDLVSHIYGRAIPAQSLFNDADRTVHACAEATRTGQQDTESFLGCCRGAVGTGGGKNRLI
ncbi:hypothetical protein GWA01_13630 [Gluconobacter wancherniae NBRC 103581]|uniref:Uncharacterized protein n=1 Tax=Gluconobacter wancherniae NBRC 103581 TaxID=656744 RepID=A0A511B1T7_9PROT|nr:hypothetical protein AA103581_2468 [Gluconobacter wancherniae NBRC 103581]GEK93593.1 hypothetical protein GWA01_13630 [Gluconobacter wancherniae NBRC 103581]